MTAKNRLPQDTEAVLGESRNSGVVSIQKICGWLDISLREFLKGPVFVNLEPAIK